MMIWKEGSHSFVRSMRPDAALVTTSVPVMDRPAVT